jgi:thioredoxin reductase
VAIIGAGPYGLSLAAYLRGYGVPFRIFGEPMVSWSEHMPAGMRLKSDGFASDLYDPERTFTLKAFCQKQGIAYADAGLPVSIDNFISYGLAFQQAMVPTLEKTRVQSLKRSANGFSLELSSGESLQAHRVIMATGISNFEYVPECLASLPPALGSHSSARRDLGCFAGKEVFVVGAGSSATDVAAALRQLGAIPTLIARHEPHFHEHQPRRSLWKRITEPNFGLGPNLRSSAFVLAPDLFRRLSGPRRQRIVKHHLGPAGGWFVRDEVIGRVRMYCEHELRAARQVGSRVELELTDRSGTQLTLQADHVISATGYRVSLPRLNFLDRDLLAAVACEYESPVLSRNFESSVPGLYFVGLAAAITFGPLLRFALGAHFTARRVAGHMRARVARDTVSASAAAIESASHSARQMGG